MNSSLFLSEQCQECVWFGSEKGHHEKKDISDIAMRGHYIVDGYEWNSCESDV